MLHRILQTLKVILPNWPRFLLVYLIFPPPPKQSLDVKLPAWLIFPDNLCPLTLDLCAWFLVSALLTRSLEFLLQGLSKGQSWLTVSLSGSLHRAKSD